MLQSLVHLFMMKFCGAPLTDPEATILSRSSRYPNNQTVGALGWEALFFRSTKSRQILTNTQLKFAILVLDGVRIRI